MFRMKHPTNPQNHRVWAENKAEAPLRTALKNPANVMAWGATSAQGLTEVEVIQQKQTVNTDHHVSGILTKTLPPVVCGSSMNSEHPEPENEARDVVGHFHGG